MDNTKVNGGGGESSSKEGLKPGGKGVRFQHKPKNECTFGRKCYRKNPYHFQEFNHKHLDDILDRQQHSSDIVIPDDVKSDIPREELKQQLILLKKVRSRWLDPAEGSSTSTAAKDRDSTKNTVEQPRSEERKRKTDDNRASSSQHPDRAKLMKMAQEATKHHGDVLAKWQAAAPYHYFLTSIADSRPTHSEPLTITFTELLDSGLGELESSLQINFMVELGWLLAQYFYTGNRAKPITIIYGEETQDLSPSEKLPSNVTAVKVKPSAFGHHHTKMSILSYKDDSIRVIVSTANLVESDWENRTQGLWISPKLPRLPDNSDTVSGESPTNFKEDLIRYLSAYRISQLEQWLLRVRRADFSNVNVFFVSSVPGSHLGPTLCHWGHKKLAGILKSHALAIDSPKVPWKSWPILAQFSSIGSLGPEPTSWVLGEFSESLSRSKDGGPPGSPPFRLIYPSFNNVKNSHDGLLGGACLPYGGVTHEKQRWVEKLFYEWKSHGRFRTRAMPHIKSYARFSPCGSFLSWFCLTSANLSKAAWGAKSFNARTGESLRILSYEAGVVFLPKFVVDDAVFEMEHTSQTCKETLTSGNLTGNRKDYQPFPLHYDIPVIKYGISDKPWLYDYLMDK